MANQAKRWCVAATAFLFAGQSGVLANVTNQPHQINYDALTVEHAELVLASDGVTDTAYVTVYNGTGDDLAIVSVKVTGYSAATLESPMAKSKGFEQVPLSDTYVVIPPKAEVKGYWFVSDEEKEFGYKGLRDRSVELPTQRFSA